MVIEDSFNLENLSEYILSIQVSLDGFSFSLTDTDKKIVGFQNTPIKISDEKLITRHFKEWLHSTTLLKNIFQKINILIFSSNFSLIPEKLYISDQKRKLMQNLFDSNEEMEIAENYIEKLNARFIFELPKGINSIVQDFFGECEIVHPLKTVLNNLPYLENDHENSVFLLLNTDDFYSIVFNNKSVLLVNNYKIGHANDVVYFVLNILQQLNIHNIQDTKIFLAHSTNANMEIAKALQPYFNNIADLKSNPEIENAEIVKQSFLQYF